MTDYRAFRKMLEEKGLVYHFSDDTGMYDIYQGYIGGHQYLPPARCFLVSVPAYVARRDIGGGSGPYPNGTGAGGRVRVMTTKDRIVEYGYDCRYDGVSGMLVILSPCYWVDTQGYVHPRIVEELVSVPADDYRRARELIDMVVGLRAAGLLQ